MTGDTDEEVFENFIVKIEELKARVGIKKTIRDYGVTEEDFLATLDEMCEQAFDDQCTGANPRYPLISEIKAMYTRHFTARPRQRRKTRLRKERKQYGTVVGRTGKNQLS